jgi:phage shock protein E
MKYLVILATALMMSLQACNAQNAGESNVKNLNAKEFVQELKNDKNAYLIDVRTSGEYNQGNLSGAENIDFYSADFKAKLEKLPKDKTIYVYCASGNRSGKAAYTLNSMGYKVVNARAGYGQLANTR